MFGLADRIRLGPAGLAEGRDLQSKCREREVKFLVATRDSTERPDPAPWRAQKCCIGKIGRGRGWLLKLLVQGGECEESKRARDKRGGREDRRQKDKSWAYADLLSWCDRLATGNVDASCLSVANLRKV